MFFMPLWKVLNAKTRIKGHLLNFCLLKSKAYLFVNLDANKAADRRGFRFQRNGQLPLLKDLQKKNNPGSIQSTYAFHMTCWLKT
jgi:hypothetical protein